jgi:hypothetical protein
LLVFASFRRSLDLGEFPRFLAYLVEMTRLSPRCSASQIVYGVSRKEFLNLFFLAKLMKYSPRGAQK